jgi:hypothetical protein
MPCQTLAQSGKAYVKDQIPPEQFNNKQLQKNILFRLIVNLPASCRLLFPQTLPLRAR